MTREQDPDKGKEEQMGNNPSDAGTNRQQQQNQGGKGPQHPAASGSHQTLQSHSSGHDQVGKSAGRTNSNDDSGNGPHRGG